MARLRLRLCMSLDAKALYTYLTMVRNGTSIGDSKIGMRRACALEIMASGTLST